ncbi:MAG: hydrogenase maturation protease [Acidimicrobiales bacterium]
MSAVGRCGHQGRRIVVGVGNRDRGDDGVGPAVCDRVAVLRPDLLVWVVEADPTSLAVRWTPGDRVVLVDAVVSGAVPGTVHELGVDAIPPTRPTSTHGLGVAELLALSTALGTLPRSLQLLGVEAGDVTPGTALGDAVAAAVEVVARRAVAMLCD